MLATFASLGAGTAPTEEETASTAPEPTAEAVEAPAVPPGPPPDPNVFAIPDPQGWPETTLPGAGVALRLPPDARITESGRFGPGPQEGPYVGLALPSGREVQIDASGADIEYSTEDARAHPHTLGILHEADDELVTRPFEENGCTVMACRNVEGRDVCAITGAVSVLGVEGRTYPTLRDCGVMIAIMRSLRSAP